MSSVTTAFIVRLWTTMVRFTTVSLPHWFKAQIKEDALCPEISQTHLVFQHHALVFSVYSPRYKHKHKGLGDRLENDYIKKSILRILTFLPSIFSRKWRPRAETLAFCLRIWCWLALWPQTQPFSNFSLSIKWGTSYYHIPFKIQKYVLNSHKSKD